tara:strand:+ start:1050 stop:1217 length:168 start_codon:yes stop_codon:yes gene_type:complete
MIRIGIIYKDGKIKGYDFDSEKEMENFVLEMKEEPKKIRVMNKNTNEVYTLINNQ